MVAILRARALGKPWRMKVAVCHGRVRLAEVVRVLSLIDQEVAKPRIEISTLDSAEKPFQGFRDLGLAGGAARRWRRKSERPSNCH